MSLGELTTEIAIACLNEDFCGLRSLLAQAWEEHEVEETRLALKRATAPLTREQKLWFEEMIVLIQSGGEPEIEIGDGD